MKHGIGELTKYKGTKKTLHFRIKDWKMKADEYYVSSENLSATIFKEYEELQQTKGKQFYGKYHPSIYQVYLLLVGFSIENLLKGIVLYKNPTLLTEKLNRRLTTHDLSKIALQTGLTFDDREQHLFILLSPHISCFSKYPIPLHVNEDIQMANYSIETIREAYIALHTRLTAYMINDCGLEEFYRNIYL